MPISPSVSAVAASIVVLMAAAARAQEGSFEFLPGFWPRDLSADGSTLALTETETWNGYLYRSGHAMRPAPSFSPSLNTDGSRMMWTTGNTDLLIGTGWENPGADTVSVFVQGSCPAPADQGYMFAIHSDEFERISALLEYVDSDGLIGDACRWHGTPDGVVDGEVCGCPRTSGTNCGGLAAYSSNGSGSIVTELRNPSDFTLSAWIDIRWPSGECISNPRLRGGSVHLYNAPVMSGDGRTVMFETSEAAHSWTMARCRDGAGCWPAFTAPGTYSQVIALSSDGRVALGSRGGGSGSLYHLWRPAAGTLDLAAAMRRCGLVPTLLPDNGGCFEMSSDGTTFAGVGADASGVDGAWILRLPAFSRSDLDWSFVVDSDDVITFFTNYEAGDADYNDTGVTNVDDVIAFFADWELGL